MTRNLSIQNNAKLLRKNMTIQERKLWNILRNSKFYGLKFKRQVPIENYVVDFLCEAKKIILEIDGGQHNEQNNIVKDNIRTDFLNKKGYKVIRIWNNDINNNFEGVYLYLKDVFAIKD